MQHGDTLHSFLQALACSSAACIRPVPIRPDSFKSLSHWWGSVGGVAILMASLTRDVMQNQEKGGSPESPGVVEREFSYLDVGRVQRRNVRSLALQNAKKATTFRNRHCFPTTPDRET